MMISAILFDKDGTLFDFDTSWSVWAKEFLTTLAGGDPVRAERLAARIGFDWHAGSFRADSCVIAGTDAEAATALLPLLPGMTKAALIARIARTAAEAPMAEAVPLTPFLDDLAARGLHLGVATNDSEYAARAHLRAAHIHDRFAFIAGADSGHRGKPDPGMCLAFAAAVEVAPENILMVGDSLHDLHAGRAAGMRTFGVLTGMACAAELAPHADIVLPDIGALADVLGPGNRLNTTGSARNSTQTGSQSVAN